MIGINKKEKIFNLKGIAVSTIPFIYQPCFDASFLGIWIASRSRSQRIGDRWIEIGRSSFNADFDLFF